MTGRYQNLISVILILGLCVFAMQSKAQVRVKISNQVSGDSQRILNEDLRQLSYLPFRDSQDQELHRFFQISENQSINKGLEAWLGLRARYIMSEYYLLEPEKLRILKESKKYPEPEIVPSYLQSAALRFRNSLGLDSAFVRAAEPLTGSESSSLLSSGSRILMTSIGGLVYGIGKSLKLELSMDLGNLGWVPVRESRAGVFKVGDRLFQKVFKTNSDLDSWVYRIRRLETIFHEARHGDGHGKNLLFPHSECPQDNDYAGDLVCDAAGNGSYKAGSLILKAAIQAGANDLKDIEILKVLYADRVQRVLSNEIWDDAPEGLAP